MSKAVKVFTDGASKGNPGQASIGIHITDDEGNDLLTHKECIGETTNNMAEYLALVKSIDLLKDLQYDYDTIDFFSDSELMVKQITGVYKIKHKDMSSLSMKFWAGIKKLDKQFTIKHIPRAENKVADKLANEAIDEQRKLKKAEC